MAFIEQELLREKLWHKYIIPYLFSGKLKNNKGTLKVKETYSILTRFMFNSIITKIDGDDPVFIFSGSPYALEQLQGDFSYFKIISISAESFYSDLQKLLSICFTDFQSSKVPQDSDCKVQEGKIYYKNRQFNDVNNLSTINPNKAVALNIRYNYLKLETHGLANNYKKMGFETNSASEAFSNPYNRYFQNYYSAFPDLEGAFGSKGSFFDAKYFVDETIMCNPIFDCTMIKFMIEKILNILQGKSKHKFILTLPGWKDFTVITNLQNNKFCKKYDFIQKKDTEFIDSMTGTLIKPCDIYQVELSNM